MLMSFVLTSMYLLAVLCAAAGGRTDVSAAVMEGAQQALRFCFSIAGGICLWSGVMEILEQSGATGRLAALLRPLLRRLFPRSVLNGEILSALSENVSANLLGLGNAATPAGVRAARGMAQLGTAARDELCLLVVLNTASLQLLPTTVASVRAAAGARAAFDILPAVWGSSLLSVTAGLLAARFLRRLWP